MSINQSHAANGNGVVIFNGERILIFYDGCELALSGDHNLARFKGDKLGRIYLTSHRVVFVNKKITDALQSISMPFIQMRQVELKQPIFGANKIEGKVVAETNGGFEGVAHFSVSFKKGGAIEFGQAMLEAGKRASQNRPQGAPPPYMPPPPGSQFYQAPPAAYAPPYQDPYYNFVPYHDTFQQPPPDYVYMLDQPPPYPGAGPAPPYTQHAPAPYPQQGAPYPPPQGAPYPPQGAPYPPGGGPGYGYPAPAAGAAPGYYSSNNQQEVYTGASAPSAPPHPPPYSEAVKKND